MIFQNSIWITNQTLVKSIAGAKYESNPVKKWTISTSELENLMLRQLLTTLITKFSM